MTSSADPWLDYMGEDCSEEGHTPVPLLVLPEAGSDLTETFVSPSMTRYARKLPRGPFDARRKDHAPPPRPDDPAETMPIHLTAIRTNGKGMVIAAHPVVMDAGDWRGLKTLGYDTLYIARHGVAVGAGCRSVAKLICNAADHEVVVFRDGDRFNLRRENMAVIPRGTHYRATGHRPALPSDGKATYQTRDGRTKTKRKAWGKGPKERLAEVLKAPVRADPAPTDPVSAATAYDSLARTYHGAKARPNFAIGKVVSCEQAAYVTLPGAALLQSRLKGARRLSSRAACHAFPRECPVAHRQLTHYAPCPYAACHALSGLSPVSHDLPPGAVG